MVKVKKIQPERTKRGEVVVHKIGAATAARGIAWSIPNQITVLRVLLTPLFIAFLLYDMKIPALAVFCLSGISDALDGLIARRDHQATTLGAQLDPVADKFLLDASFLVLSYLGVLPLWVAILVVSRDAMIVSGALYLELFQGEQAMPPSLLGKTTTCIQLATIFWALLFHFQDGRAPFLEVISAVAATATFVSGIQYLLGFMRRVSEPS